MFNILNHPEHKCEKAGCTEAIILDGNMKNHRAVCAATHAGYIVYKNIPGQVRNGCQNSPAFDSSCTLHKPVLAIPQHVQIQHATSEGGEFTSPQNRRAGWYYNKRKTRNSTFYEVNDFAVMNIKMTTFLVIFVYCWLYIYQLT